MSDTHRKIVIYGAGGSAREVAWLVEACGPRDAVEAACFVDDNVESQGQVLNGLEVLSLEAAAARFPRAGFVAAVGGPDVRERLVGKAVAAGFQPATLVAPDVQRSRFLTIDEGAVICAGCILTCNIHVGAHAQVNLDCTITHDAILEDYATLAPGVHISGCVHIGRGAYIGTGAVIINGTAHKPLRIGQGAIIGAGACVTRDVAPGQTAVGVPAKPIAK